MTNAFSAPGWPIERGVQTLKEVHYLNMRTQSAAAGLDKLWSDTFLTSAGINAGASSGYSYRGSSNYDVIRNSSSPVSLLLHMNDTGLTDDSASPATGTLNGGAVFSSTQKKFGNTSLYCDGAGDYLRYADAAKFDIGTGDFCVEGFFRADSLADAGFWDIGGYSGAGGIGVRTNGTDIYLMNNNATVATAAHGMSTGSWYHVAVARSSGTVKIFIAGTEIASASFSTSLSTTYGLDIGGTVGVRYFTGYIDCFRVSNVARYTSGFTPTASAFTTDANTLLLCNFENLATDSSTYAHTVTHSGAGAAIATAQKKFGAASVNFDDTAELTIPIHDGFKFGTGQFCVDLWVRPTALGSGEYVVMSVSPGDYVDFGIYLSSGGITVYINDAISITYGTALSTGVWQHIALTRDGTDIRLFVDGVVVVSGTSSADIQGSGEVVIGRAYNGYVDEVRITKGDSRYTAGFTVPSTEGTAEAAGDGVVQTVQCLSLAAAVTSAMVFCEKTVNAGAVTVEISSDNGSTWTTVTNLDQIIPIPSGTQIVLRATITSDAELESWGVAV